MQVIPAVWARGSGSTCEGTEVSSPVFGLQTVLALTQETERHLPVTPDELLSSVGEIVECMGTCKVT